MVLYCCRSKAVFAVSGLVVDAIKMSEGEELKDQSRYLTLYEGSGVFENVELPQRHSCRMCCGLSTNHYCQQHRFHRTHYTQTNIYACHLTKRHNKKETHCQIYDPSHREKTDTIIANISSQQQLYSHPAIKPSSFTARSTPARIPHARFTIYRYFYSTTQPAGPIAQLPSCQCANPPIRQL